MGFTKFYWDLPGFTGFDWLHRVLLRFGEFYMFLTRFNWVLIGFYRVLLSYIEIYRVFIGFDWVFF